MQESAIHEPCSVTGCALPAVHSEFGEVGHWFVTIFYCREHARELHEGTPIGSAGIDTGRVRIEPLDGTEPPPVGNQFPGID